MDSEGGLWTTAGRPIPLEGVEVQGEILGGHARVRVRQRYRNGEARPVEAVYTFPLPTQATLVGFTMTCAGRRLEGVVKEREEAFRAYDEAVSAGHGAALLDQERKNVFTAQVGNLLPGEETVVEVEYVERVTAAEGALRWMIPTLVAPRYIPGAPSGDRSGHGQADPTDRVPDADRITPPIAAEIPYGLRLDLVCDLGREVTIESPSHEVQVQRDGTHARVTLARSDVALDRDVVLLVSGAGDQAVESVVAHRGGEADGPGIFALTIVPELERGRDGGASGPRPQDVIFVIDVSGSMEGESLPQAQAALRLCLRHLREGDRLNAVAFSDQFHAFAPRLVPFGQRSLEEADRWVNGLRAHGGTELLAPLLHALDQVRDGVVVLLTDGQVGNEEEILRRVVDSGSRARVYSFGIGTNVSDQLLRDLAVRSGGAVELIHPGERLDEKIVAQFARAVAPRVTDLKVRFQGGDVSELAPTPPPALVDGDAWVLYGHYEMPGTGTVILDGRLGDEPFHREIPFDLPARAERPHLPKLWAAERVRDLERAGLEGRRAQAMKDRIVRIALEHGLSTAYTSFVVVEQRTGDRRAHGQPEARVVPVNVPAGWDMFKAQPAKKGKGRARTMMAAGAGVMKAAFIAPKQDEPRRPGPLPITASAAEPTRTWGGGGGEADDLFREKPDVAVLPAAPAQELSFVEDPAMAILDSQLASGLWGDAGRDPEQALHATAAALLGLLRLDVTAYHPVHGAQVKKAIDALLAAGATLAWLRAEIAELVLAVAWLLAGRRTRGAIEKLAQAQTAAMRFPGERDLRARVDALASRLPTAWASSGS